ncbi:hypothetical protein PVAP13_4NG139600 [Panicum virgatum]|uniref:Uncharacterized protein n=1 Tax=Panicum virgatum TaxID=38727 RepID=A0A8T0TCN9_PANVG|nr:hypothetical protein PVAP13_4NG139600 [Panicum virgatum]
MAAARHSSSQSDEGKEGDWEEKHHVKKKWNGREKTRTEGSRER